MKLYDGRIMDAQYLAEICNVETEPSSVPTTDRGTIWHRAPIKLINETSLFQKARCRFDDSEEDNALKKRITDMLRK